MPTTGKKQKPPTTSTINSFRRFLEKKNLRPIHLEDFGEDKIVIFITPNGLRCDAQNQLILKHAGHHFLKPFVSSDEPLVEGLLGSLKREGKSPGLDTSQIFFPCRDGLKVIKQGQKVPERVECSSLEGKSVMVLFISTEEAEQAFF